MTGSERGKAALGAEVESMLEGAYCAVPGAPRDALPRGIVVRSDREIDELERDTRQGDALLIRDRLPEYLRRPTPEDLLTRVAHPRLAEAARRWVPARGSLVLIAPTREAKSAAAAYVFRRLIARGIKHGGADWRLAQGLAWLDATDIETASGEHALGRGKAPELLKASRASVLFIDDLGWDRDPKPMSEVLHARYKAELVTVATTRLPVAELDQRYGGAALRRLFESGGRGVTIIDAHAGRAA